jgi:hypothetical protein
MLYQLASHQRELISGGPVPPRAAADPPLQEVLRQQKIQIIRDATAPENSGRRVKLSSPLFFSLNGPKTSRLVQDLLTGRLAAEFTLD